MPKPFTDTQRIILSNASTRDNGRIFPVLPRLTKSSHAIALSLRPLIAQGMVAEVSAEPGDTPWGQTTDGLPTALAITHKGLEAIGVVPTEAPLSAEFPLPRSKPKPLSQALLTHKPPSPTSKLGILIANLTKPDGATLDELTAVTGWQKHSVRGAISGALKVKHKLTVQSTVGDNKQRVYRIVDTANAESQSAADASPAIDVVHP